MNGKTTTPEPILPNLEIKAHTTMTSLVANRPSDATHLVFATSRWETNPSGWTDLPGARIHVPVKVHCVMRSTGQNRRNHLPHECNPRRYVPSQSGARGVVDHSCQHHHLQAV